MTANEYRVDPLKKTMVSYAPRRTQRPVLTAGGKNEPCPFDAGRERFTPPTTFALPSESRWRVRCFENAFSLLVPSAKMAFHRRGDAFSSPAAGRHEVIVETRDHDARFEALDAEQRDLVFQAYQERYRAFSHLPQTRHVFLFKNHGKAGGASIAHEHAQILALPFVPELVEKEERQMKAHYLAHRTCLFEHVMKGEKGHWVEERNGWVAFVPSFGRFPGEIWIAPSRHVSDFSQLSPQEGQGLMRALQRAIAKMSKTSPDYTLAFHSLPNSYANHFHVEIYPRSRNIWAGVELGSGLIVNTSDPLAEARAYRKQRVRLGLARKKREKKREKKV